MERAEALALLNDQHEFPGSFAFRAFIKPGARAAVLTAVAAARGDEHAIEEVTERPSRSGKWVSLRLHVHCASAEQVVAIYEVLHALDEVAMTL